MTLEKIGTILSIVVSLIGIWQFVASKTDLPVGDGPAAIVRDIGDDSNGPVVTPPPPPATGTQLDTPSGVSVSGDCESGFMLTWQPVEGAERYRIERDGFFAGQETDTDHSIPPFPDGKEHSYRVFADAFQRPRSEASDEVVTEACTF